MNEPSTHHLAKRYDFVVLYDVQDGNPNGDPDAGNLPRIDPETGHGLVTDVCLKRKVRNFVSLTEREGDGPRAGYEIYVREGALLNDEHDRAYQALPESDQPKDKKKPGREIEHRARRWMCQNFFDIRTFGAVMSTGINCGQVRGPVQLTFGRSIEPILTLDHSITRCAATNEKDREKRGEMGRKTTVPYALYRTHGFISPPLAAQTGFGEADLHVLWRALEHMFEHDRSASRGLMSTRAIIAFEHDSALGNAPAHKLFERVKILRTNAETAARAFSDYRVELDGQSLDTSRSFHLVNVRG